MLQKRFLYINIKCLCIILRFEFMRGFYVKYFLSLKCNLRLCMTYPIPTLPTPAFRISALIEISS